MFVVNSDTIFKYANDGSAVFFIGQMRIGYRFLYGRGGKALLVDAPPTNFGNIGNRKKILDMTARHAQIEKRKWREHSRGVMYRLSICSFVGRRRRRRVFRKKKRQDVKRT